MRVRYSRRFRKQYARLPRPVKARFQERLRLWLDEPKHTSLRIHPLQGRLRGYWSMNVTGDYRAIFRFQGEGVEFDLIGTHSELYG